MVSGLCFAQYSDHQLYQAYLAKDMPTWGKHIASAKWNTLNLAEQKRLLNYEYGYTAYVISQKAKNAEQVLSQFETHLQSLKGKINTGEYHAYMTGLYSFKLALDRLHIVSYATSLFDHNKQAAKLAPQNPFVVAMQGNVEFYNPMGSKRKALDYYRCAEKLLLAQRDYPLWNLRTVQMNIVYCLHKMGNQAEALQTCKRYIDDEPGSLIFNELLQSITKK
jgi:hypothetical protein